MDRATFVLVWFDYLLSISYLIKFIGSFIVRHESNEIHGIKFHMYRLYKEHTY